MATSAFFAVLRDVTKLAASAADDLASQGAQLAASADDIASMTGSATVKTAGVAGDDLAVGAGQISGVHANRELPALWKIAKGSATNKVWLGSGLLVIGYLMPVAITWALVFGALYLAFEGAEGLLDYWHASESEDAPVEVLTEEQKVKGAINTDMVLSLEMLVIAMAAAGDAPVGQKIVILVVVGLLMTVGVYGTIGLIIRLDDMGLALARMKGKVRQRFGRGLVAAAPIVLRVLGPIGMIAMFAVAGGILMHLLHLKEMHWAVEIGANITAGVAVGLMAVGAHHGVKKLLPHRTGA